MTAFDQERLTACERALWQAAPTGALLDLRSGDVNDDDPAGNRAWGAERTLRADILHQLLVAQPSTRALVVRGARISGALNLAAQTTACPLVLEGCRFDGPINLSQARVEAIYLNGSQLTCVQAAQLTTRGDFQLRRSTGLVVGLRGAQIGGDLNLDAATLNGGNWPPDLAGATMYPFDDVVGSDDLSVDVALVADGLRVDGEVLMRHGFAATGEVRLVGARVRGQLNFNGARFRNPSGFALNGDRLTVDGSMFFQKHFVSEGELRLIGARVRGQLNLTGARLTNEGGTALNAAHIEVGGSMLCRKLVAVGELRFLGARVGGQLNFNSARLTNKGGSAVNAARAEVGGSMLFRKLASIRHEAEVGVAGP
jgi:hypothetical protein